MLSIEELKALFPSFSDKDVQLEIFRRGNIEDSDPCDYFFVVRRMRKFQIFVLDQSCTRPFVTHESLDKATFLKFDQESD